jgi:hypothetical protein
MLCLKIYNPYKLRLVGLPLNKNCGSRDEISRKKPILANRVDPIVEKAVLDMAIECPAYGQLRVSNELKKDGILVSPGGIRSIWLRNDLNNLKKRLVALETKMAQDGIITYGSSITCLGES